LTEFKESLSILLLSTQLFLTICVCAFVRLREAFQKWSLQRTICDLSWNSQSFPILRYCQLSWRNTLISMNWFTSSQQDSPGKRARYD